MTQLQADRPTLLQQQLDHYAPETPIKVLAQDERRVGLWPMVRRRSTACGVQPIATVPHTCASGSLYGAVDPTTGDRFCLELPWLNTTAFQLWLAHVAAAFPQSCHSLVRDKGACHTAKAWQWPSHIVPVFLPP